MASDNMSYKYDSEGYIYPSYQSDRKGDDEEVYDDIAAPTNTVSKAPIEQMTMSEPVSMVRQNEILEKKNISITWRKIVCLVTILIIVIVISMSVGGVGAFYGSRSSLQAASNVPIIECPSPDRNESTSVIFNSPVLRNFPDPERVYITYSKGGILLMTLPATTPEHELHDFYPGITNVTVVAADSILYASCFFEYVCIPDMECRDSQSSSSNSIRISRPTTNFIVTSPFYYFRDGVLASISSSSHNLYYLDKGETTVITVAAADSSGNSVSCSFTVNVTGSERGSASIRLVGGRNPYEGRVEVYHDDTWGTVCGDSWDTDDAKVVCYHLGYYPRDDVLIRTARYFGQGSGQIWLTNVSCSGRELRLNDCNHPGWGVVGDCGHHEDAGVVCTDGVYSTQKNDIRLAGGESPNEGRVEVNNNGVWGTVCDRGWDVSDAIVVCRQLGLPYGAVEYHRISHFGGGTGDVLLYDVQCIGIEENLSDCAHDVWGSVPSFCQDHGLDARVTCTDGVNYVRLEGGVNTLQGRVEVLHNGVWGTICSDSWDITDALVICRQLGFPDNDVEAVTNGEFGPGTGDIWMDDVQCDGSEEHIGQCDHDGWGVHDCVHTRDAGVVCK